MHHFLLLFRPPNSVHRSHPVYRAGACASDATTGCEARFPVSQTKAIIRVQFSEPLYIRIRETVAVRAGHIELWKLGPVLVKYLHKFLGGEIVMIHDGE